jgi:hypothetical protein
MAVRADEHDFYSPNEVTLVSPRGPVRRARWIEIQDWLDGRDSGASGVYRLHITPTDERDYLYTFDFSNEATAFHFKMRFG